MCINTNSFGCSGRCFLNFHVYIKHMVCVLVIQSCPTLWEPMDGSLPGFSVHGILQARIVESVGCHALLQGIFPTQELNPGLPNCRQILYWLNYQGSKAHEVVLALWAQVVIRQVGFCLGTESLCFLSPSRRRWCCRVLCSALSRVRLYDSITESDGGLGAAGPQAPLFRGFSGQESWSGLPFPTPGDLSNPGIEPVTRKYLHWCSFTYST